MNDHKELLSNLKYLRSNLKLSKNRTEYIRVIKLINGLTDSEAINSLRMELLSRR